MIAMDGRHVKHEMPTKAVGSTFFPKDNDVWTLYLPLHVREIFAQVSKNEKLALSPLDPQEGDVPMMLESEGVVGIVDISGYSALASQLYKKTNHAGEVLQRVVNEVFEPILDIIKEHGGDVIKFAGDAILVSWSYPGSHQRTVTSLSKSDLDLTEHAKSTASRASADRETQLNMMSHAIASCWKIGKMMRGYTKIIPELEKPVKLDVHTSLAAGVIHHVHVGVKGTRREYFLSGPATLTASSLLDKAKRGMWLE